MTGLVDGNHDRSPFQARAVPALVAFLRDTRHLAGRAAEASAPAPPDRGLALKRTWDETGAPVLLVAQENRSVLRLPFSPRVRLLVTEPTHCVGRLENGRHVPCPARAGADRFEQCPECHPLPDRDCVFDPRCVDCTLEFCTGPHEVYLAFYGPHVKVGMTRAARGGDRLIEQGADATCQIASVAGRKGARDVEERVTRVLGIPQSVATRRYLPLRAGAVPSAAIEATYHRLAQQLVPVTGGSPGPLVFLPPGRGLPLPEAPVPVPAVGHHDGTTVGGKGRHLFYRATGDGVLRALDLDRVVTHEVRFHIADAAPIRAA